MLPTTQNTNTNKHLNILNFIINTFGYKSYLEIGVYTGENFLNINCQNKECCDVTDKFLSENSTVDITYLMTSDEMFEQMNKDKKYDLIFIDGMHTEECADKDIINSLKHLNPGGMVCLHDTIVYHEKSQIDLNEYPESGEWNGTTWKSITKLQDQNIEFYTIDNGDYGLTCIFYNPNFESLKVPDYKCNLQYNYVFIDSDNFFDSFTLQGRYILHVIDVDDFITICNYVLANKLSLSKQLFLNK